MPEPKEYSYTFNGEKTTYTVMEPTKKENLASLEDYPLFIATVDYFATGEGMSRYIDIRRAKSLNDFIDESQIDGYFLRGAKIYKNELPLKDSTYKFLISKRMHLLLEQIVTGERDTGNFHFYTNYHQNLS